MKRMLCLLLLATLPFGSVLANAPASKNAKVNNGPVMVYTAGQSFSENPGDRHGISANASETQHDRLTQTV